jgi:hypothetical protein
MAWRDQPAPPTNGTSFARPSVVMPETQPWEAELITESIARDRQRLAARIAAMQEREEILLGAQRRKRVRRWIGVVIAGALVIGGGEMIIHGAAPLPKPLQVQCNPGSSCP